ncbi:MAG: hypothetical protein M1365_11695 [Actinobacteria bacterium]|nr:hypothetical protein [Actinomycetota bacterium]
MKHGWIKDEHREQIRAVFEPRYKKGLSENEVILIAENLTEVMESFLKMKWREKYGANKIK